MDIENDDVLSSMLGDSEGVTDLLKNLMGGKGATAHNVVPDDYEERVKAIISTVLDRLNKDAKDSTADVERILVSLEHLKRIC